MQADRPTTLVQDGGFEAGAAASYWGQSSTNFEGVICGAACGFPSHTGTSLAWFGGTDAAETSVVEQSGAIIAAGPGAGPKELNFYLLWSSSVVAPPDPDAYFKVMIDGNTIFSITPATASAYHPDYAPVSLDISTYADGATHTLRFEENNAAKSAATNVLLDDISMVDDRVFASGFE